MSVSISVFGDFKASDVTKVHLEKDLSDMIKNADVSICDFEVPIKTNNSHALKSGPVISQSPDSPKFLENLGFDVVLLANNHIMDFGKEGCLETMSSFSSASLIGVGDKTDAYKVLVKEINGIKIGFLSLCQFEFGIVEKDSNQDFGVAWINHPNIHDIIVNSKKEVDYLLIFPHAGTEYMDAPLPEWKCLYKNFIDWGADGIFAAHPHVPQGWETYKEKPIFYSLGNFYFQGNGPHPYWHKGLAVQLVLDGKNIVFKVKNLSVNNGTISIDNSSDTIEHNNYLLKFMTDEDFYMNYIDSKCEELYVDMQYGLLRGLQALSFRVKFKEFIRLIGCILLRNRNEMFLLNALRCESHKWVIERALYNRQNK